MRSPEREQPQRRRPAGATGRGAVVAVVAALAAGLAGCVAGGGTGPAAGYADHLSGDPLTAVRSAADITGRAGSVRARTTLTTRTPGKQVTFHGTGAYDYVSRVGEVRVVMPAGAASKGVMTEIVAPGTVYLLNSGAKVPAGTWVRLDVRQLPDGNLVSSGATDPATAAGALRGALAARLVGTEWSQGVRLGHYRGVLDLAKAATATGGTAGRGLRMAYRTFTEKRVPYDVWLDTHGRIHKVREVFTFASEPGSRDPGRQVHVTSTTRLADFGAPVTVARPKESDVYSVRASG